MNKRILSLSGIAILALATIIFGFIYFSDSKKVTADNPQFRKYISAYTGGMISKKSSIKIKLLSDVAEKIHQQGDLNNKTIKIDPNVKGKVRWIDEQTIEFIPEENLPSNTEFFVSFRLRDLIKVPKKLAHFNFKFKTLEQNFEVNIQKTKTIDFKTLKWQKTSGIIHTADVVSLDDIKTILTARQGDRKLKIHWKTNENRTTHYFEIDSIKRSQVPSKVQLEWDGDKIGVDKEGTEIIEIPSLSDFKFMSYEVMHQPQQYLQLQFSDPLLDNQELDGIIQLKDVNNVRYIIEDNIIKVYPGTRLDGTYKLSINEGLKNILDYDFKQNKSFEVVFELIKPAVRKVGKGVILPDSDHGLVFPFEAVNLKAVDVQVIRIFENNITQFLQVNDFEGTSQLKRVGEPVIRKTIHLDETDVVDFGKWNRFTLDLNELVKSAPGAIYRVTIGFRKKHSLYACANEQSDEDELESIDDSWDPDDDPESSYWDSYFDGYSYYYGYGENYWENRDNPCHKAYYGSRRSVSQNLISSNFGLIAKSGDKEDLIVFVNDLRTTEPLKDVEVEVLNYQSRVLEIQKTGENGKAVFENLDKPYFIIAKKGSEKGYLKLKDGASLSFSHFDVSGKTINKGLKGFIYGERGVWRPGDSLYISFILHEEDKPLPEKHPIVLELRNPKGQLIKRFVQPKSSNGFHTFRFKTPHDAPTGNWSAKVIAGGAEFHKQLKIETVKPNRLKINFDFGKDYITKNSTNTATLKVTWLHGAIARNLDANVKVFLSPTNTSFNKYTDYQFEDITKDFNTESSEIFDGELDSKGEAYIKTQLSPEDAAPGMLQASFLTKVFEPGGNFSIDKYTLPYHPYSSYVGIKTPKGDKARGMLLTDTTHQVKIVTVTPEGNLDKSPHRVEMSFYKLSWRWWWDKSTNDLTNFTSRSSSRRLKHETITTSGGTASWDIKVNYPNWGRYLVYAKDLTSGHTTAKVVYIDWPGWAGRQQKDQPGAASMLIFTTDKDEYTIGENIDINIPSSKGGRALISVENGTAVLQTYWVKTTEKQTQFSIEATPDMSPNVFINVTLLQPHAQTANDLPIRLYGVVPVKVQDPATHLKPQISMPDELEAEQAFKVTISEKNNKPMTYTLAVVDEGLLDLTRFKTPEPWNEFYAREALGVKTWDMYDWVIGAYGGELQRLLSIGGSSSLKGKDGQKANRFEPVVKFLGPFHLKRGKKVHKIQMPRYVGSVRTMVIAGHECAFGSTEKTTPVRKPLMLLATLPRVLGPGESVKLPVSVFAMKDNIKNVSVAVKTNDLLDVSGNSRQNVRFSQTGEKTIFFDLTVPEKLGIAKVQIEATSGSEKATYEVELDIRNPNPVQTDFMASILQPGENWTAEFTPLGIAGTNKATLEVSSIPPLNLDERLGFLIRYPHGCIEQTTSGAFPQLYLTDLVNLNNKQKEKTEQNIKSAIKSLNNFQHYSGGFTYWPGHGDVNEWGTNYAGHFMIEAQKKGYSVPEELMANWKKYQRNKARNWVDDGKHSQVIQSYRLFTLALANEAEKGAMNRLREIDNLHSLAQWRLAAAYQLAGKERVSEKLLSGLSTVIPTYRTYYTYGSDLRDKAMILETLTLSDQQQKAFRLVKEIAEKLSSKRWLSTQTTAYALIGISKYIENNTISGQTKFSFSVNGNREQNVTGSKPLIQNIIPLQNLNEHKLAMQNNSKAVVYSRLILQGQPLVGAETSAQNDMKLEVKYFTLDGKFIDHTKLIQGTDFVAKVRVINPGSRGNYKDVALSQIFPSGWEIINVRMLGISALGSTSVPDYQDIRDDRVYTYFDLDANKAKVFKVLLNASYAGKFYLPAVSVEPMYDATINARKSGQWVEVVRPGDS